jgi:hypothetical protein
MKKYFFSFIAAIAMFSLSSCFSDNSSSIDYIPFRSSENGRWGMMSVNGEVVFEEEFKNEPSVPSKDRFFVQDKDGMFEIYTVEETPNQVGGKYIGICTFTDKVTPAVQRNQRIKLIDTDGKEVATLEKAGGKNIVKATMFFEGVSIITTEDGCGCIDTKGKVIVEPKYKDIAPCSEGKMLAMQKNREGDEIIAVLDKKGQRLFTIKSKYEPQSFVFRHGYLPVMIADNDEEKCGFINSSGEEVLRPSNKISRIFDWTNETFIYSDGEGWGLKNFEGETLIRPKYEILKYATDNLLWAGTSEELTLIDLEGKEISSESYWDAFPFWGDYAFAYISENDITLIDKDGKELKKIPDISALSLSGLLRSADYAIQSPGRMDDLYKMDNFDDIYDYYEVRSDFVDFDQIVASANITRDGFGGFNINSAPSQLIKVWKDATDSDVDVKPERFTREDVLEYEKETEKVNIAFKVYYKTGYLAKSNTSYNEYTWSYSTSYSWTTEKPYYVKVTFRGYKMYGKTDLLFSRLLSKAKTLGRVYKADNKTALITIDDHSGIAILNQGDYVEMYRYSDNSYKQYNVSGNSEYESADTLLMDSIVADSVYY